MRNEHAYIFVSFPLMDDLTLSAHKESCHNFIRSAIKDVQSTPTLFKGINPHPHFSTLL